LTKKLAHKIVDVLNDHRLPAGIEGKLNHPEDCAITLGGKSAKSIDDVVALVQVIAAEFSDLPAIVSQLQRMK
jgi:hypothetical protein